MGSITGSAAEKETFTIAAPLVAKPELPTKLPLSQKDAQKVVISVLGANIPKGGAVMVHGVTYLADKPAADKQEWYSIDLAAATRLKKAEAAGDFHPADQYKNPRIFGASNLGLVYLHILQAASREDVDKQLRGTDLQKIQNNLKSSSDDEKRLRCPAAVAADKCLADVTKDTDNLINSLIAAGVVGVEPISEERRKAKDVDAMLAVFQKATVEKAIQDLLKTGASGQITLVAAGDGEKGDPFNGRNVPLEFAQLGTNGGYFVVKGFSGLSKLTYTVEVTSKESAPYSNLKAIVGFAFDAHGALPLAIRVKLTPTAFAAGGTFETTHTVADVSVTGTYSGTDGKDLTLGPKVYDNEKRYWYDFSLVLPIKSYKELTYDSTANGLTARSIKKNNLYAAFNVGLPRDTKRVRFQAIPVLLYGLPIAGQPLKHHLFAASVGLNYVNFFAGIGLDQKNFYHDFTKPLSGNNVFQVWRTHLTYGLNFDPLPLIKSLSGKK
jgi:hypothetical protein